MESLSNALQEYQDLIAFIKDRMDELEDDFWLWLSDLDEPSREQILSVMGDPAFTLEPHQIMPDADAATESGDKWRVWFLRMGRGAGKTHAAATNVNLFARYLYPGLDGILVGPTVKHVRDVMIQGESGLLKTAPADFMPVFNQMTNQVRWPNGSKAMIYTADNKEGIRGPSLFWGWGDELTLWQEPTFDNLRRAIRNKHEHGTRLILGTSPISAQQWVKAIEKRSNCVTSTAASFANRHGLDEGALEEFRREAETGSRKAREEVLGEWIEGTDKLWTLQGLEAVTLRAQHTSLADFVQQMDQLVLSIDPGGKRDLTGIVLIGKKGDEYWVLGDWSMLGSKKQWEAQVVSIREQFMRDGDRVLVETNAHNDADVDLRALLKGVYVEGIHQRSGNDKASRAERAHQLYENEQVRHFRVFPELHQQMDEFYEVLADKKRSPDRVDALVTGLNWMLDRRPAAFKLWKLPLQVTFRH